MKMIRCIFLAAIAMTTSTASAIPIKIALQMSGTNLTYGVNESRLPFPELESRMELLAQLDSEQLVLIVAQPEVPVGQLRHAVERFWKMKLRNVRVLLMRGNDDGQEILFKGMEPLRPEDLKGKTY